MSHRYQGRLAVLSTKHRKLGLIAPPLARHVGLVVDAVAVDTDRFGTFTGDVARSRSAWDTAVAKARLGMQVAGCPIGLASEGTIGPHPDAGFLTCDTELVVMVDDELGIVVGERETGWDLLTVAADVSILEDLDELLERGRFPSHAMTVRPADGSGRTAHKGIRTRGRLAHAVAQCAAQSSNRLARVETDMRAQCCPSRRPVIARCAARLARRLASSCPECDAPGWGVVGHEVGLPCGACGATVPLPRADVWGCARCPSTRTAERQQKVSDPTWCDWCNP